MVAAAIVAGTTSVISGLIMGNVKSAQGTLKIFIDKYSSVTSVEIGYKIINSMSMVSKIREVFQWVWEAMVG